MKIITLILFLLFSPTLFAKEQPSMQQYGPVRVLMLSGSYQEMGKQYGRILQKPLRQELAILKQFYTDKGVTYAAMVKQANLFYDRFPAHFQQFMQGEAESAGLSLDDVKILNAMETMIALVTGHQEAACAFLFIPASHTTSKFALIGRNYDYPPPFDRLAKFLTVTILAPEDAMPTAFISLAGEIYCASCVNANGLFMELNNGMHSGGQFVDTKHQSLLITMLDTLQHADSINALAKHMQNTQTDFSLIVNAADKNQTKSFEHSSTLGVKTVSPVNDAIFASTNFYLSSEWDSKVPQPTDNATWKGITRRNNLLKLANTQQAFDVSRLKKLMDKSIEHDGALWEYTIYQFILDENDLSLYVKIVPESTQWVRVPLGELFMRSSQA